MTFRLYSTSRFALTTLALFSLWSAACQAKEITSEQARTAVNNWLRRDAAPLDSKLGRAALEAVTYRNAGGAPLFHVVPLEGGGFVVTSADDGIEPVIAFSEGGNLAAEAGNPLWALLNKDLPQRNAALNARRAALGVGRAAAVPAQPPVQGSPEAEWGNLLADRQIAPQGLSSISDVRIAPIVQSHWGQSTVAGFWGSYNCYNYYTPNSYVCGCVATAMAQIMRKHCYPTSSVPAQTFTCFVDDAPTQLIMKGGVYSWGAMSLTPDEGFDTAPSETVRAAIGKLCYDAGVSVGMMYSPSESAIYLSNTYRIPNAFVDVFGYASASICSSYRGVSEDDIRNAILANLDHGFPVCLIITGDPGGHAVVADGYGFNSGNRYIHLNMGWNGNGNGGYQNAWYNVPTVDTTQGTFSVLEDIVFNIFPDTEKKLVSGRVLSDTGQPVANATVLVRDLATDALWLTLATNSKGMYAFSWDGNENWFDSAGICATDGTKASCEINVTAYLYDYGVGNVWGADLCLDTPASQTVMLDSNGGCGGSVSVTACLGTSLPFGPMAPSRPGYVFEGYYDSPDSPFGIQYYDANMNPVGFWHDVLISVLYARWKPVAVQIGESLIPYTWFNGFGIDDKYETAAAVDLDGDGSITWQEYVAGTDPTNKNSVFRITGHSRTNLVWSPNLPDRIYTVVGKTNLTDSAEFWTSPTNANHRFFRVRVVLP